MRIYLSIPYTGMEELSFAKATKIAGDLMVQGLDVYSPVTHCHPMTIVRDMSDVQHGRWMSHCLSFVEHWADCMWVCKLNKTWYQSKGVRKEMQLAQKKGIPIMFVEPDMWNLQQGR